MQCSGSSRSSSRKSLPIRDQYRGSGQLKDHRCPRFRGPHAAHARICRTTHGHLLGGVARATTPRTRGTVVQQIRDARVGYEALLLDGPVGKTLVELADERDAAAIVLGPRRGLFHGLSCRGVAKRGPPPRHPTGRHRSVHRRTLIHCMPATPEAAITNVRG